jgi:hypothetical protein
VTNACRYLTSAFCNTKLLVATPSTIPKLLHKINVLVTTACSACSLSARMATKVPGNWKPWPMLAGTKNATYNHGGIFLVMLARQHGPTKMRKAPSTTGHFRRRDQVTRTPVVTPHIVEAMVGTRRWSPEEVADSRRTAWKKMGTLKKTALMTSAEMKLEKMMLDRGERVRRPRGMMGRSACCST